MRHEYQDRVSFEIARRIASELPQRPEWMEMARANLKRWSTANSDAPSLLTCYTEWASLLDKPVPSICAVLTAQTDEGQRLRQTSPFAGALSPQDVWEIKRRLRHEEVSA